MTPQDATALLAVLDSASMRYAPAMDEHTVGVWYQSLRDVAADLGLEAARRITATDEDFPTIARFLRVAGELKTEQRHRALPAQGATYGYRCKCQDMGVVCGDPERDGWHPCPRCRPDAFARWQAGEYRPKMYRGVGEPMDVNAARASLAQVREVLGGAS